MRLTYVLLHVLLACHDCSPTDLETHLRGRIRHQATKGGIAIVSLALLLLLATVIVALLRLALRHGRWGSQLGNSRHVLRNGVVKWWRVGRRNPWVIALHIEQETGVEY